MFCLPERYIRNTRLNKELFQKFFTGNESKVFKEKVKSIFLYAQIEGEAIPNRIDETYNVQAILFLKIYLSDFNNISLISKTIQKNIKEPAVIIFLDSDENCILSFTLKRLNETDKTKIVVDYDIISKEFSLKFNSDFNENFHFLEFNEVISKKDKVSYYYELAIKAYIISNLKLYNNVSFLLNSKIWYNFEKTNVLFKNLKSIETLKNNLNHTDDIIEKMKINSEIKSTIGEIEKLNER